MPKTVNVKLGESEYPIRQFKIAQLEEAMVTIQNASPMTVPFAVLRMAMKASGHPSIDELEAGADEVAEAFNAVMELNGMKEAKPGEAVQGTAAA